jgi:hypothetical protein
MAGSAGEAAREYLVLIALAVGLAQLLAHELAPRLGARPGGAAHPRSGAIHAPLTRATESIPMKPHVLLALLLLPTLTHGFDALATTCLYPPGVPYARAVLGRTTGVGSLFCEGAYTPLAQPTGGIACTCLPRNGLVPSCTVVVLETDASTEAACVSSYPQAFTVTSAWKVLKGRKK